jgi:hypothetical protein
MNKPDWRDAPEWANFLAMDWDGEWVWHEHKPSIHDGVWLSSGGEVRAARLPRAEETLEAKP